MFLFCLLLLVDSFLPTASSSSTRFALPEQIVVGRPYIDRQHEDNNSIIVVAPNQNDDYKLAKSLAFKVDLYPPIGERSLADILANSSARDQQKNSTDLVESVESIDKPTIEGKSVIAMNGRCYFN